MRLAQLARKVKVTPTEVKRFLEDKFELTIGKDPNFKLDEDHIEAVVEAFPLPIEPEVEKITPQKEDITPEPELISTEDVPPVTVTDAAEDQTNLVEKANEAVELPNLHETSVTEKAELITEIDEEEAEEVIEEMEEKLDKVEINYEDTETEDTENAQDKEEKPFEEVPVDRSAPVIGAPKVKLDGLKILGKIELPSDKKEELEERQEASAEELSQKEQEEIAQLDAAMQSAVQDVKEGVVDQPKPEAVKKHVDVEEEEDSPFKDKRGIYHFSAEQKANREKHVAEIDLKRQKEAQKEAKKKHYEEMMAERKRQKTSKKSEKIKAKKTEATKTKKAEQERKEQPKGLWQRFKNWLND